MSSLNFEALAHLQSAAPLHKVKVYRVMQASAGAACLEQSQLRGMPILWNRFFLELPILSLGWVLSPVPAFFNYMNMVQVKATEFCGRNNLISYRMS